ncbi:MAG: NgoFVII family restriction endonuclease [Planctomycetia bacterium]|nr:NgoFVII family restriction endonuclease [Planctomycetia bacterium]
MCFYHNQTVEERQKYVKLLGLMGSLSNLFSTSDKPYLDSRVTENLFCLCLGAKNLARFDCTADAQKGNVGIGIKTWVSSNAMQKIAEFNRLRPSYVNLTGIELVRKIADFRNDRIAFTMRNYNINQMIYHCTVRSSGKIYIQECPLDFIDVDNIQIRRDHNHNIAFSDGINEYSFNMSKSVLLKRFNNMKIVEEFPVQIIEDPYQALLDAFDNGIQHNIYSQKPHIYLGLYSVKKRKKFIPEKSGLNQWNGGGRARTADEIYIPIRQPDHQKTPNFFPPRDTSFILELPNGNEISAKLCQDNSKALMSNPNSALGKWLLRDVLHLQEGELLTYEMLERLGIDSVVIEKISEERYRINFAKIGSYEKFMGTVAEDSE